MALLLIVLLITTGLTFELEETGTSPMQQNEDLLPAPFQSKFNLDTTATNPIIRLHKDTDKFFCTGIVIDTTHALTAAHCVVDSLEELNQDEIVIKSNLGAFITKAKVEAIDLYKDSAIIRGDFSTVQSAWPDFTGQLQINVGDTLTACGYPSGQKEIYCVNTVFQGNYEFKLFAKGPPLIKGMSGGPVLLNGRIVGVNSAVNEYGILYGIIIGLQELAIVR
jgi:hypothetical protein